MEIKIKLDIEEKDDLKVKLNNIEKPYRNRKKIEKIKIGSICSDCTNPTEKVMESYIFDIENIIEKGMYEKAQIATEVLMERYDDPTETALNKVFPAVNRVVYDFHNKMKTKVELIKALQAADIAMDVLETNKDKDWEETRCKNRKEFLKETVKDCCDFLLP